MTPAQPPGRVELRRIEEASLNGLQTQRKLYNRVFASGRR